MTIDSFDRYFGPSLLVPGPQTQSPRAAGATQRFGRGRGCSPAPGSRLVGRTGRHHKPAQLTGIDGAKASSLVGTEKCSRC